ncbi:hypothetical protein K440DRAFT_661498 [Wilcoxina mikolae CBS 423.85]|nr:hypothetical protein K440DRAFT_661498 [Wilcoxina mikolae CBS 423.85]
MKGNKPPAKGIACRRQGPRPRFPTFHTSYFPEPSVWCGFALVSRLFLLTRKLPSPERSCWYASTVRIVASSKAQNFSLCILARADSSFALASIRWSWISRFMIIASVEFLTSVHAKIYESFPILSPVNLSITIEKFGPRAVLLRHTWRSSSAHDTAAHDQDPDHGHVSPKACLGHPEGPKYRYDSLVFRVGSEQLLCMRMTPPSRSRSSELGRSWCWGRSAAGEEAVKVATGDEDEEVHGSLQAGLVHPEGLKLVHRHGQRGCKWKRRPKGFSPFQDVDGLSRFEPFGIMSMVAMRVVVAAQREHQINPPSGFEASAMQNGLNARRRTRNLSLTKPT